MGMGIVGLLMIALLMLGFPFVITLLAPLLAYFGVNMPNMNLQVVVQQLIRGFSPASLVAVPMFILAANIMTSGKAATRLVEMIRVFVGHIPGGWRSPPTQAVPCSVRFRGRHRQQYPLSEER